MNSEIFEEINRITNKYDANLELVGDLAVIKYEKIGQGSIIMADIEEMNLHFKFRLMPSDMTLIVEVVKDG